MTSSFLSPTRVLEESPDSSPDGPARPEARGGALATRLRSLLQARTLILAGTTVIIGYLTLTPLIYLVYGTFTDDSGGFSLGGFQRAYGTDGLGKMALNSVVFAVGTMVVAVVIGTLLAYVTVRTNVPFRAVLVATAMVPMIIPGLLYAIAWIILCSKNVGLFNQISNAIVGRPVVDIFSMPGMIWVQGTHLVPLAYLFMVAAFRSMDPSLEESALVCGASRLTMLRRISIPLVRPALAAAVLITFVDGLTVFEVPVLIGVPDRIYVFTSVIYDSIGDYPQDFGKGGALSLALVGVAVIGVVLVGRLRGETKEYATVTGKGFRPATLDLGKARLPVGIAVLTYFVLTTVLPVLVLVYTSFLPYYQKFSIDGLKSFSFANYRTLFADDTFRHSLVNSIELSLGSATVVTLLTAVGAWLVVRSGLRGRQVVDQLAFLPLVVPGLVMGVGIAFLYLRNPLPIPVYGTMLILYIAYVTRFMPYGMRYAVSALSQISPELEESAEVSGASWFQIWRKVVMPLMIPGLVAGWIYIVIISIRELSSSILLYSPGNEVLSITVFQFFENGQMTVVSALSVVLVVGLIVFVGIAYRLGAAIGIGQDQR